MTVAIRQASDTFTPRQQAVLTAALDLLVEAGDGLTMTAVARRASCSKETLYKWFGDRDGLLTATVQWQAAKVRMPVVDRKHPTPVGLPGCRAVRQERDHGGRVGGQIRVVGDGAPVGEQGPGRGVGPSTAFRQHLRLGRSLRHYRVRAPGG